MDAAIIRSAILYPGMNLLWKNAPAAAKLFCGKKENSRSFTA